MQKISHVARQERLIPEVSGATVQSILEDREGSIWVVAGAVWIDSAISQCRPLLPVGVCQRISSAQFLQIVMEASGCQPMVV